MLKYLRVLCVVYLLTLLSGCTIKSGETDKPPYNPNVEAFTSGKISKYAPVYLILNQDIAPDRQKENRLKKLVRITPQVPGEFLLEDNRTIVFKPTKGFERDQLYTVTADLSEWLDVEEKDQTFTFRFTTLPLALHAQLETFDIHPKNERGYDLTYNLFTADKESAETVQSLVRFSEQVEATWQHRVDGKKHQVILTNVLAGSQNARPLVMRITPNKLNIAEEDLCSIEIPNQNEFSVYNVTYTPEPEQYIEVTFTQLLDETQDFQGLAFIEGNTSDAVEVDGNTLRLYPDAKQTGALNVHLNTGIRSKSGLHLFADVVRQVEVGTTLPNVRFIGKGVIIPQSTQLTIPFQAVYLRGVMVRIIKVLEQNIGQFLQVNNLDDTSDLMRVGRLVTLKTIFLDDDPTLDLTKWNTFAIDLKEMIQPEPGAIYRVELSFNKELSAYPCDNAVKLSKEQIRAHDAIKFKEESSRFDEGGYYYGGSVDWTNYKDTERDNPCSESYYFSKQVEKNILATNLGLIAMAGEDNKMTVLVHNLIDTRPVEGVQITIYNYQHQLLATTNTDGQGLAKAKLTSGKPFYLIASQGTERSYLRVDGGSALSLSSFDVSGEVVQKGIKGFIYGDRGIWRPGDTLHLGFMLHDRVNKLPASHPVVMELYNPLGQLYTRKTETKGELGVYVFDVPTEVDAPTGAWSVKVNVGGVSFSKRLRIETIKPNRLKINLNLPEKTLLRDEPLNARMHVEWLQGATARNLKYDIQGTFISAPTTFAGYKGFTFDNPARTFNAEESKLISGTTDEKGNAIIQARFELGTSAPGMLLANFVTRVFEESGDFSLNGERRLYSPYQRYAGIKSPQQDKEQLNTGETYTYEVASVDYLGQPQANVELDVQVYKVDWYWWWSSDNSSLASFVSDSYNKPIQNRTVRTAANGRATFDLSFDKSAWGTYFITVSDKASKHATGLISYFDWPNNEGRRDANGSESATMLSFKTDKDKYIPGEKIVLTIPSTQGSRAIVCVENGTRVLSVSEHICKDKQTVLTLDVTPDMQPNAYIYVTLLQPHGVTKNDLPIRMYGVVPFSVTSPQSHLTPVLQTPTEIKPENNYTVTISEKNGREMAYTLAIVDEGLLDLTNFRTPEPWKAFNAREALGVNTWDVYNYVLGAYGGRIEQLFSIGGDDALNKGPKAIVNRFKPVVQFDGPFRLKKGQKQTHTYKMPAYLGRVRVMAVAGNGEAYGEAEKSVWVRKPVMLIGTLPRVIGLGEEMVVPATVFATEAGIGPVKVTINCSDNMEVVGAASQELNFKQKGDKQALFRIRVKSKPGTGKVTLTATSKEDQSVYKTELEIRSVRRPVAKVVPVTLEPGKSWHQTITLPGTSGTNSLTLEMSDVQPLNLSFRLSELIGYPYGCLEQIVSKGFPQLYLSSFASLTKEQTSSTESTIKEVIRRLRSYQTVEGSFAYWPGGTSSNAWGTAYATQFLLEAEMKGYLVPAALKQNAVNNLSRVARDWKPTQSKYAASEEMTEAYRLYVLALAQLSEIGAMNRLKEHKPLTSMSRWMLAAAYALVGRSDVATGLIGKTTQLTVTSADYDQTFGSPLRDQSIRLLTLCLLNQSNEAALLANEVSKTLSSDEWLSTQSTAFSLVALSHYMNKYKVAGAMDFAYTSGKKTEQIRSLKNIWTKKLLDKAGTSTDLTLKNTGKSTLFARILTQGVPEEGKVEAYANGLSLAVSYVDRNGQYVDVSNLQQGTNFVAVVTVKNPSPRAYNQLVLSSIFPAGWEILNTRYLNNAAVDTQTIGISYQDIRDDRVASFIDNLPAGRQVTVRINLCAVYPGQFYLSPVYCEAMYDYLIRANTTGRQVVVR